MGCECAFYHSCKWGRKERKGLVGLGWIGWVFMSIFSEQLILHAAGRTGDL